MTYGKAVDEGGSAIDEAMAVLFKAPRSYTREDVLKSTATARRNGAPDSVACVRAGARLAEPGEFTKRAFFNGRIDLAQAEGRHAHHRGQVGKSGAAIKGTLEGALSRRIDALQDQLLNMDGGHRGAAADYRKELEETTATQTARGIRALLSELEGLIAGAATHGGLPTGCGVHRGQAERGQVFLKNALLGENRAIVTDIAGTTRDVLTEPLTLNGIPLILSDTAGLRTDGGFIEQIGIRRAREEIDRAESCFWSGTWASRSRGKTARFCAWISLSYWSGTRRTLPGRGKRARHPLSVTISP
jgi:tRNA modification GTPase